LSPARKGGSSRSGARGLGRSLHRALIAAEALLVLGVVRDWAWRQVLASSFASWAKVALAMVLTVGLFGGFFLVAERLLMSGVSKTHQAAASLPVVLPTLLMHAALLGVLFVLWARMLGVTVF
jgi:hypothetical protein